MSARLGQTGPMARAAERIVSEMMTRYRDEFRTMARDPLFAYYGGDGSPSAEEAYARRRLAEYLRLGHYAKRVLNEGEAAIVEAIARRLHS